MTRLKSPQTPAEGLPAPEPSQVPSDIETASVSLPSPHLKHDGVLVRELTNRLSQFDTALEVVIAEKDGLILRHEQDISERHEKHNLAIAELERQAQDIDKGRKRLLRALEEGEQ